MLVGIESYLQRGGRLMYLGGNGFYWRIAFHPERPGLIEMRRAESGTRTWGAEAGEYAMSFNGELGGLWRHPGQPPLGIGRATRRERVRQYRENPEGAGF